MNSNRKLIEKRMQLILSLFAALILALSCVLAGFTFEAASAVSVDYPAVFLRISTYDNSRNINITGYTDKTPVNTWATNGGMNENWRFDLVGSDANGNCYQIVNQGTGRLLTPMLFSGDEGTQIVIHGKTDEKAQQWYVTPVQQDKYGNDLYYKITSCAAPDMALTYFGESDIRLSKFSGSNAQKWLLNAAGLQGFAGFCKTQDGSAKASAIGGTLGKTVEVRTFDELKNACTSKEPLTIVVTGKISGKTGSKNYEISTGHDGGKRYYCRDNYIYLQPNKTIIGSYSANSLYNVYFRTYNEQYGPAHNVIIRNIDCTHDTELNTDNIWEFAYGWNFWIDHCNLQGHNKIETSSLKSDDWDKLLNFKGSADYITISDCRFGHHEYGVLLGYPVDDEASYKTYNGTPCATLTNNYYRDTVTRAPGLMRYGYFHSFNNYVINFDMGYTIYTACKLYSESNYFEAGTGKGSVVNDTVSQNDISSKYPGFYTDSGSKLVGSRYSLSGKTAKACTWRPNTNYTYKAMTADQAKTYCETYSGSQTSAAKYHYAALEQVNYPAANYVTAANEPMVVETTAPTETTQPTETTTAPETTQFAETTEPTEPQSVSGDVNADGQLSFLDLVAFQKWLLCQGTLIDGAAADVNGDGCADVFDLALMKRMLLAPQSTPEPTEPVTEATTEMSTEPPTEATTEIPTEVPTEAPTQAKTAYEPDDFQFSGKVYLVGDSTVCEYDDKMSKELDRCGWGMKLAEHFNAVTVTNLALSGRSSRSFLNEQNYQTLKNSLGKGDYLFIQFGHNDEKTNEAQYPGLGTYPALDWNTLDNTGKDIQGRYSYEYLLTAYYINLAKSKGAVPVLVTPITRLNQDGTPNYQQHTAYQQGMKQLGQNYNVAVIDMTALTTQLYTNLYNYGGLNETKKLHCYTDAAHTTLDYTHLSSAGAWKIAQMIAEQTKELGLTIGEKSK